ncbi:MAG: AMP nucleosidase [Alphaproteobacteria bacterium]|nr:AMP nucleosidase [Alphaproteobacteria bacterium]
MTTIDATADADLPDAITVLADEFTPAAMEYHRRELGKRGYELAGPILPRTMYRLEGPAAPSPLFDGKPQYAATFVRKRR